MASQWLLLSSQAVLVSNLDAILLEAREAVEALPEHLLAEAEALLQGRFATAPAAAAEDALPEAAGAAVPGVPLPGTRRPTAAVFSGTRNVLALRLLL